MEAVAAALAGILERTRQALVSVFRVWRDIGPRLARHATINAHRRRQHARRVAAKASRRERSGWRQ